VAVVTMRQLLEAGVHFGHQTRRWNPKMRRFIFGERNGIYIIDLNQTLQRIEAAYSFVRDLVAGGGTILFVGTKKQAQDPIAEHAKLCGMPYVNERWLGGMLTNFATVSSRVKKLQEYERMRSAGDFDAMPKKEALHHARELAKLERNLGGIQAMSRLPDALFVIDTKKEHIAVTEANKLGLPIVAVVDTNCDPDVIQYVIPGNDDAIRSGALMCRVVSEAVLEGRFMASRREAALAPEPLAPSAEEEASRSAQQAEARRQAALQQQEREARLAAARASRQRPPGPPEGDQRPVLDRGARAGERGASAAGAQTGTAVAEAAATGTSAEDAQAGTAVAEAAPTGTSAEDVEPTSGGSPGEEGASLREEGGSPGEEGLMTADEERRP
jgi:small subunit ribosomal protein S2